MLLSKVYEDAERRLNRNEITLGEFQKLVDIEVVEPKQGEWIDIHYNGFGNRSGYCNQCGFNGEATWGFCPNCGAKMKGAK